MGPGRVGLNRHRGRRGGRPDGLRGELHRGAVGSCRPRRGIVPRRRRAGAGSGLGRARRGGQRLVCRQVIPELLIGNAAERLNRPEFLVNVGPLAPGQAPPRPGECLAVRPAVGNRGCRILPGPGPRVGPGGAGQRLGPGAARGPARSAMRPGRTRGSSGPGGPGPGIPVPDPREPRGCGPARPCACSEPRTTRAHAVVEGRDAGQSRDSESCDQNHALRPECRAWRGSWDANEAFRGR